MVLRIGLSIINAIKPKVAPVIGLIWKNWTTGWTSLNNTWNSYH